jgi:hypothetical protein
MKYDAKKNQGVKFSGVPKKIYNFSPDEKIETILIILINDLGKEVLTVNNKFQIKEQFNIYLLLFIYKTNSLVIQKKPIVGSAMREELN